MNWYQSENVLQELAYHGGTRLDNQRIIQNQSSSHGV